LAKTSLSLGFERPTTALKVGDRAGKAVQKAHKKGVSHIGKKTKAAGKSIAKLYGF
jgi:hypothetical protein